MCRGETKMVLSATKMVLSAIEYKSREKPFTFTYLTWCHTV